MSLKSTDNPQGKSELREILSRLVPMVARAYYDPRYIVVLDLLNSTSTWKDEDLAKTLHLHTKDLHRLCGKLKYDGLIKSRVNSTKSISKFDKFGKNTYNKFARRIQRTIYYIDHKSFVDVVKWKIYRMGKLIEQEAQAAANVPYKCPSCERSFSSLDFAYLEKTENMLPLCDVCKTEIEMEPMAVDSYMLSEKYAKFMNEIQPLVDLLKKTDKFDASEWLQTAADLKEPSDTEKTDVPETQSTYDNGIIVELGKPTEKDNNDTVSGSDSVWKEAQNIPGISAYYKDLQKTQLSKPSLAYSEKDKEDKTSDNYNDDDDDFEEI